MPYYAIHDLRLNVACDDAELRAACDARLAAFRAEPGEAPAFVLRVHHAPSASPPPTEWTCLWRGRVMVGADGATYAGPGGRRYMIDGFGWLDVDLGRQAADLHASRPDRQLPWDAFLLPLICNGLGVRGWCTLHAATLAIELASSPRAAVIVARSETGKTTTALALSQAPGFRLLGDDATFIRTAPGAPQVWAYPRACHVRVGSLAFMPWLHELPLRATREVGTFSFPLEALDLRAGRPPQPPSPLAPGLVVCLMPPNPDGHRVTPLDPAAALAHISYEAVQALEGPADPQPLRDFATLARLVQSAPACALSVGPRLEGLDRLLIDFLTGQRHERASARQMALCAV
jgi:hypothetical protein